MGSNPHMKTGLNLSNLVGINPEITPVLHPTEENIPDENVPLPLGL